MRLELIVDGPRYRVVLRDCGGRKRVYKTGMSDTEMGLLHHQTESTIVVKTPGRAYNMSGVRGMPMRRYVPAEFRVLHVVDRDGDAYLCVSLADFPTKFKPSP